MMGAMVRCGTVAAAALVLATATGGCTFYFDTVNAEPDAIIRKVTLGPHRTGDTVTMSAMGSKDADDPVDMLQAKWVVYRCNDALGTDCPQRVAGDELPIAAEYEFTVTARTWHLVTVEVSDERRATDVASLVVEVGNAAPVGDPRVVGCDACGGFVLGTWVDIIAEIDDPEDEGLTLEWELFEPDASQDPEFAAVTGYADDAYRLVADVTGEWKVHITATDAGGETHVARAEFDIVADAPPCIASIEPGVAGATYVVGADEAPRRFAALAVGDDLDPFPLPADPHSAQAVSSFRWYLRSPDTGDAWTEIAGHRQADYLVDPAAFAPGDVIGVRVDAVDRQDRPLPCDDADPTCSIAGDSCLQRVTWGVEIR